MRNVKKVSNGSNGREGPNPFIDENCVEIRISCFNRVKSNPPKTACWLRKTQ